MVRKKWVSKLRFSHAYDAVLFKRVRPCESDSAFGWPYYRLGSAIRRKAMQLLRRAAGFLDIVSQGSLGHSVQSMVYDPAVGH